MKNIKYFLPIFVIFCSFCEKNTPSQVAVSLTNGAWIQSEYLEDWDKDGVFDDAARPCEKDDTWNFQTDMKFELKENGDPCDVDTGLLVFYGNWEFQENETILRVVLAHGFNVDDYQIESLSDTLLVLNWINPDNPEGPVEEKFILRR